MRNSHYATHKGLTQKGTKMKGGKLPQTVVIYIPLNRRSRDQELATTASQTITMILRMIQKPFKLWYIKYR